jgi:hypothetical protein
VVPELLPPLLPDELPFWASASASLPPLLLVAPLLAPLDEPLDWAAPPSVPTVEFEELQCVSASGVAAESSAIPTIPA